MQVTLAHATVNAVPNPKKWGSGRHRSPLLKLGGPLQVLRMPRPDLKVVTQRQLQYAIVVGLFSDLAERWRVDIRNRRVSKVRVVEQVERLGTELDCVFLRPRHRELLRQRHIEIHERWSTQIVAGADASTKG